ncbi:MAG: transcriptional regulator FilR1 domain-containing protein, partial [Methanothermobacter sp.]
LSEIRFIAGSRVRSGVILNLLDGEKRVSEIKDSIMISNSATTHALMELEERKLVERSSEICRLTSKGKLMGIVLSKFMNSMDAVRLHREFWNKYLIESIPAQFLMDINVFRNAYIVEATSTDLQRPYTTYVEMLDKATYLRAMLSSCLPRHTESIARFLESGGRVELILTPVTYHVFLGDSGLMNLQEFMDSDLLRIGVLPENQKISYLLSDTFFSMSLFKRNAFDSSKTEILMGHGEEILQWGNRLFDYHWSLSSVLDSEALGSVRETPLPLEE